MGTRDTLQEPHLCLQQQAVTPVDEEINALWHFPFGLPAGTQSDNSGIFLCVKGSDAVRLPCFMSETSVEF